MDSARHYYALAMSCDEAEGLSSLKDFGRMIAANTIPYANESDKKIFGMNEVDIKPDFPLGEREMFIYMYSRIKYPPLARENGVDGTALIEFIVEKDGTLSHYKIRNCLSHGIGEESLRMAKLFSKFKPGIKNGQPVRVLYVLPVKFKLV
ncbi:MAG: energy transducer TonB [Saprospiraceae bacterium]|nr:energy transducer TonB [Saprospiraceae bacterium]